MSKHKIPLRKNIFEATYSKISKPFSAIIIKTSLTPNQITIISGLFGIAGAYLLTHSDYNMLLVSAFFIQLFTILDLVDGDVARGKKMQSIFGKWLDIFFDKLNDFLIIIGLSIGEFWRSNDITYLYLGIVLMGLLFLVQFFMLSASIIMKEHISSKNETTSTLFDGKQDNVKSTKQSILKRIWTFVGRHLLLEHVTGLLIITIFIVLNQIGLSIWILTIHAFLTLLYIIISNVIKLKR